MPAKTPGNGCCNHDPAKTSRAAPRLRGLGARARCADAQRRIGGASGPARRGYDNRSTRTGRAPRALDADNPGPAEPTLEAEATPTQTPPPAPPATEPATPTPPATEPATATPTPTPEPQTPEQSAPEPTQQPQRTQQPQQPALPELTSQAAHTGTPGWHLIADTWFYYDTAGRLATGWAYVRGVWYFLASDGAMLTGWLEDGGGTYYLDDTGRMRTGWYHLDGDWYFFNASGERQTGWKRLFGTWYHLDAAGRMSEGWLDLDGRWYYLTPTSGHLHEGWLVDDNAWFYLQPHSGEMASAEAIMLGGRQALFARSGLSLGYSCPVPTANTVHVCRGLLGNGELGESFVMVSKQYGLPKSYNPGGLTPATQAAWNAMNADLEQATGLRLRIPMGSARTNSRSTGSTTTGKTRTAGLAPDSAHTNRVRRSICFRAKRPS